MAESTTEQTESNDLFPEADEDWETQMRDLAKEIFEFEEGEEARDRGSMFYSDEPVYNSNGEEIDMGANFAWWWGKKSPAVRANVYVSLVGIALTAPEYMTDLEVTLHAFASQDDMAMKAVEQGQVQAIELEGDVDVNGVLVDEDWYKDNIHFGGDVDASREALGRLYGAGMLPGEDHGTWVGGEQPDNMMRALKSGWNLNLDSDRFGRGAISDKFKSDNFWEDRLSNFWETLDAISFVSSIAAPLLGALGTVQAGAAPPTSTGGIPGVKSGFLASAGTPRAIPTTTIGRLALKLGTATRTVNPNTQSLDIKGNPALNRNAAIARYGWAAQRVGYYNTYGKTPQFMRPWTYASLRTGTPLRGVIQNAATSDQVLRRPVGRGLEWSLQNRGKIGLGVTSSVVLGTVAKMGIQATNREEFEGGMVDAREEFNAREAQVERTQVEKRDWIEQEGPGMARDIVAETVGTMSIGVEEGEDQ